MSNRVIIKIISMVLMLSGFNAYANLQVERVSDNIYALVGTTEQRSPENLANNSTHGVIVTDQGVILVDPGGSYLGAKQIHQTIKWLTDKPVKWVINTGGQDHRWLGNDYFQQLGAEVIASNQAVLDHKARAGEHLTRLDQLIGDSLKGTEPAYADITFDTQLKLTLGGVALELYHFGPAHTLGDAIVWLPKEQVLFSGDVVYVNRMLGVGPARNINSWIQVFEKMAEFKPKHIVPGHGQLTNLEQATQDTYRYLRHLRDGIRHIIEDGGDMMAATNIDQEEFRYLKNFDSIARRNSQWTFEILEFED